MKIKHQILPLAIAGLLAFGFTSCSDDDDSNGGGENPTPVVTMDIIETALSVDDLSILVEALTQAELVTALQASGDRTVLAPTNEAFQTFLDEKGFASLEEVPNDVLSAILLNHVIDGSSISSTGLSGATGYANTLATGAGDNSMSIFFNGIDGVVFNGVSTVTTPDVQTTNGIVHIIDAVIDLPNITTFVIADPSLSILGTSLTENNLVDTITGLDPATVFAPNDAAFTAGSFALSDVTSDILTYHVISGVNVTASDAEGLAGTESPATVQGQSIGILAGPTFKGNGNADDDIASVTTANIQALNGIIHIIGSVLLPSTPAISVAQ